MKYPSTTEQVGLLNSSKYPSRIPGLFTRGDVNETYWNWGDGKILNIFEQFLWKTWFDLNSALNIFRLIHSFYIKNVPKDLFLFAKLIFGKLF